MEPIKTQPPRWALNFFRWYCKLAYQEDIEGDLLERFERNVEEVGVRKARWRFTKDVLQLFRPGIIRSFGVPHQLAEVDMFKNNFKIASRHLLKHKYYSVINVLGLAIGFICVSSMA